MMCFIHVNTLNEKLKLLAQFKPPNKQAESDHIVSLLQQTLMITLVFSLQLCVLSPHQLRLLRGFLLHHYAPKINR
jgi:hypothetical protein